MAKNVITAVFGALHETKVRPRYQYDHGQILRFRGVALPDFYEVHFANVGSTADAVRRIGDADGVEIPDEYYQSGADIIAWMYLHEDNADGETEYRVRIPIIKRNRPADSNPSPEQQDVVEQAIYLLNTAVDEAQAASESAQNDALMAKSYAVGDTGAREDEDTDNAKYYAEEAEISKNTAISNADIARDYASQAANSEHSTQVQAEAASLSASRAAKSETNAKGYADIASAVVETAQTVLDSIPEDYTALQDDVEDKLDRVQDTGYANKIMVIGNDGALVPGEAPVPVAVRSALLDIFRHVAYVDEQGAQKLAALESAMAVRTLTAISAAISQGSTIIYTDDGLDQLRPLMTVTATYSDGTTAVISDYTLTGTLAPGECVIGVQYGGMTDTVTVTATQPEVTVVALSVDFDPGSATIYTSTPLSDLRQYLTVMALYSNGMSAEASTYTIEGTLRDGANTLTVRFKGQYALFGVTAVAPVPVRLEAVYNPPAGYVIYTDDDLDKVAAYLTVTEYYSDGSSVVVTDYVLTGTLVEGMSTLTVEYNTISTTVQVDVYQLPDGYIRRECIVANGTQAILSGLYEPDMQGLGIVLKEMRTDVIDRTGHILSSANYFTPHLWAYNNASVRRLNLNRFGKNAVGRDYTNECFWEPNQAYTIEAYMDGDTVKANGEEHAVTELGTQMSASNQLVFLNYGAAPNFSPNYAFTGKFYFLKMFRGSTLVHNFIPCTNGDGVTGLYDTVDGRFLSPALGTLAWE